MGILRFILAISVLLNHFQGDFNVSFFGYQMVGGEVAVMAFFIISGFYMSLILNKKYVGKNKSFILYISNRFLRIYPLYWLVLALTLVYYRIIGEKLLEFIYVFPSSILNFINLFLSVLQNVFLFPTIHSFAYFPNVYNRYIVNPAWSLAIELAFYLMAPFLVRGGIKKIFLLLALSEILRIYVTHLNIFYPVYSLPFLFLPNLFFFMLGAAAYQIHIKIGKARILKGIYFLIPIVVLAYVLLYDFVPELFFNSFKRYILYFLLFIGAPFLFRVDNKIKFSYLLGELSYPIYISHLLIISVISRISFLSLKTSWGVLVVSLIVVFISYVLKKIVTDPINLYRDSRVKH